MADGHDAADQQRPGPAQDRHEPQLLGHGHRAPTRPAPTAAPRRGSPSYTIYDSVNGGPWQKWTTITTAAATATATFTGQSNTIYSFYSTATDAAGNTQAYKPSVEASTVPARPHAADRVGRALRARSASDGLFTLNLTGTDPGGSVLTYFEVFAEVGAGGFAQVGPAIPAGAANSSGAYQATATFLSPAAYGVSNSYKFYAIGIDAAGQQGSSATAPTTSFTNLAFAQPSAVQVAGLTVQDGAAERSYVRYLTINFNEADAGTLNSIVSSLGNSSADITLTQNNLNDNGTPVAVTLKSGMMTVIGNTIQVDFGADRARRQSQYRRRPTATTRSTSRFRAARRRR